MEKVQTLIQSRIQSLFNEQIVDIQPIAEAGEVNQVYIVSTDKLKIIARVNDAGELARFKKEQWCIEQAAQVGVKGAEVLDVGASEEFAYMLMSYVDGSRADRPGIDIDEVWRTIGEYAKQIHIIPMKGFGENLEDITDGSTQKWQNYLSYNIENLNGEDELLKQDIITQEQSVDIRKHLIELSKLNVQLGLSHGDLSLDNIILDLDGEVNVIDWGSAEGHLVPHYDLGVILSYSLSDDSAEFAQVLVGYGLSQKGYEAIKAEIKLLMLLIAIDKVRWAIDRSPQSLESAKQHLDKMYTWQ